MPRLRNGELSQTKRAVKDRERAAANRAANREVNMSDEPIGIKAQPGRSPDQGDGQSYFCLNCQAPIVYGSESCVVCEERLNWEGL